MKKLIFAFLILVLSVIVFIFMMENTLPLCALHQINITGKEPYVFFINYTITTDTGQFFTLSTNVFDNLKLGKNSVVICQNEIIKINQGV